MKRILGLAILAMMPSATVMAAQNSQTFYLATARLVISPFSSSQSLQPLGACVTFAKSADRPWMNTNLAPEERADLVLKQMSLEEKLSLLHEMGWRAIRSGPCLLQSSQMAAQGYVEGVKRLGIPPIVISDAGYG